MEGPNRRWVFLQIRSDYPSFELLQVSYVVYSAEQAAAEAAAVAAVVFAAEAAGCSMFPAAFSRL